MSNKLTETLTGGLDPQELREELQAGDSENLRRRRMIISLSLLGMGAMTAISLLQTGIIKHLPDPPIDGFNSDKVNSSDTAYALGVPDGALSLASLAANIPIAAFGGENRAEEQPIVPLLAAGKSIVEAVIAGWYFYQMPAKEKAWCGYCITGALMNFGIAALTIPEAVEAWEAISGK
ncbi:hypothetical protein BH18ACI1_BH18ACI1_05830 [soil metagenome]